MTDHYDSGINRFFSLCPIQIHWNYSLVTSPRSSISAPIVGEGMDCTRGIVGWNMNNIQKIGQYIVKCKGPCSLHSLMGGYCPHPHNAQQRIHNWVLLHGFHTLYSDVNLWRIHCPPAWRLRAAAGPQSPALDNIMTYSKYIFY